MDFLILGKEVKEENIINIVRGGTIEYSSLIMTLILISFARLFVLMIKISKSISLMFLLGHFEWNIVNLSIELLNCVMKKVLLFWLYAIFLCIFLIYVYILCIWYDFYHTKNKLIKMIAVVCFFNHLKKYLLKNVIEQSTFLLCFYPTLPKLFVYNDCLIFILGHGE